MSALLNTKPTDIILEIGTGSTYHSAILSNLVEQVYSIEIIDDLAIEARDQFNRLGYNNVVVRTGDGYVVGRNTHLMMALLSRSPRPISPNH